VATLPHVLSSPPAAGRGFGPTVIGRRHRQQSRYQRYVGAELVAVLEQVQSTHGTGAQIVSVERVRQGGVAGFFARENYEVLVDGTEPKQSDEAPEDRIAPSQGPLPVLSFADVLARRLDEDDLRFSDDDDDDDDDGVGEDEDEDDDEDDDGVGEDEDEDEDGVGEDDELDEYDERETDDGGEAGRADENEGVPADKIAVDKIAVDKIAVDETAVDDIAVDETAVPRSVPLELRPRLGSIDGWRRLSAPQRLAPDRSRHRSDGARSASGLEFWARFDRVRAEADLLDLPPVALSAVVGSLDRAAPVVRRCEERHWAGHSQVFVLTEQTGALIEPWIVVHGDDDLVAAVDRHPTDFPLLVIDVPPLLPPWLRPLLDRLRQSGLGLVHYVLDGNPTDEDLATWHGEIGRPSVLDLLSPLSPQRVVDLVDRGEPIASVGGVPLSADLLFALRTEVSSAP
jgi:hypothetical protein